MKALIGISFVIIGSLAIIGFVWAWHQIHKPTAAGLATPIERSVADPFVASAEKKSEELLKPIKKPQRKFALAVIPELTIPLIERERAASESETDDSIQLSSDLECGYAPGLKKISSTHFTLDFHGIDTRMFMFKLTGVAGKTVRIDFTNCPIRKWGNLNPLYSEEGLLDTLAKDTPLPNRGKDYAAFNGSTLPDTSLQTWHYIQSVWVSNNNLCVVQRFVGNNVLVAMKIPYTPEMNEKEISNFSNSNNVTTILIGKTTTGHSLIALKFAEGTIDEQKTTPCILVYAREHPDEHDSSWAIDGMAKFLYSDNPTALALRKRRIILLIPILDPDAAALNKHAGMIAYFSGQERDPVTVAYANFCRSWVDEGYRLDIVLNIHNIESGEGPDISCPEISPDKSWTDYSIRTLKSIGAFTAHDGYSTSFHPPHVNTAWTRFGGWLQDTYGTLHIPLELNSQERSRHLALSEMRLLGQDILLGVDQFVEQNPELISQIDRARQIRQDNWDHAANLVHKSNNALYDEFDVKRIARNDLILENMKAKGLSSVDIPTGTTLDRKDRIEVAP